MKLIKANPGITASEVAKKMKIKPNYLYRVLGDLEKEGRVRKDGARLPPGLTAGRGSERSDQPELGDGVALSSSSATEASIRAREKSSISRPSTIDHSPPEQVHGKPEMMPSATP